MSETSKDSPPSDRGARAVQVAVVAHPTMEDRRTSDMEPKEALTSLFFIWNIFYSYRYYLSRPRKIVSGHIE
ncbi:MAG: hypothetical protein AAB568_02590 [Patescibacteria group bacterium]